MDAFHSANNALRELLSNEIPSNIQALEESAANLERAAAFCEANYRSSHNKKAAFDKTKQFCNQSLASVAFQVNQLSTAVLRSLEFELENVVTLANVTNNLQQEVAIGREKAARQEIGKLTLNKPQHRAPKILYPAQQPTPLTSEFGPLNFSKLNDLGNAGSHPGSAPMSYPNSLAGDSMTTPSMGFGSGGGVYDHYGSYSTATLTKRTARPDVVRVPQPPSNYDYRYSTVTSRSGMMSDAGSLLQHSRMTSRSSILPPSIQSGSVSQYALSFDGAEMLPPPPNVLANGSQEPMPPGIYGDEMYWDQGTPTTPDWIPAQFIERARAIYDYEAEKADELNLRVGCVVYVVAKNDDGWYEGVMDGMTGLFPSNYVETIPHGEI